MIERNTAIQYLKHIIFNEFNILYSAEQIGENGEGIAARSMFNLEMLDTVIQYFGVEQHIDDIYEEERLNF